MSNWHFFWCDIAAPDFTVSGVSFEQANFKKFEKTGLWADVVDPIYGQKQRIPVYRLKQENSSYRVAYTEWTACVYVAFADDETLPHCSPRFRWDPAQRWIRID